MIVMLFGEEIQVMKKNILSKNIHKVIIIRWPINPVSIFDEEGSEHIFLENVVQDDDF